MNNWSTKNSISPDHGDNILDNYCLISEADDSGHFTASPEADGAGDSEAETVDVILGAKNFSCNRVSPETLGLDDDSDHSVMSSPALLLSITKNLQKNAATTQAMEDARQPIKNVSSDMDFPQSYLGEVLKDFQDLFEKKLQSVNCTTTSRTDSQTQMLMMERKNEVLEKWAKDVCSQNMLLVHTVEELEEEANRKVKTLQNKINATTNLARSHMEMIQQYEKQVEDLLAEQAAAQKKYELLHYDHMDTNRSYKSMQQRLDALESDNDSLRTLICRIRDMGVWDVSGLQLHPNTYDLLFGLYPNLAGSDVQTVFTRAKASNVLDNESKIKGMVKYISELEDSKKETDGALDEKQRTVTTLEAEIKSLTILLKHYQEQCDDFKRNLERTASKLIQATNKSKQTAETAQVSSFPLIKREQDVKDMLNELRDLKNQLKEACDERQGVIYETNVLKQELGGRTMEMMEMKSILQSIQTEAQSTRSAIQSVQEKQDYLSSLKKEVQSYQIKYEQAKELLSTKCDVIQSLQQQMDLLHAKIFTLEDGWDKTISKVTQNGSYPHASEHLDDQGNNATARYSSYKIVSNGLGEEDNLKRELLMNNFNNENEMLTSSPETDYISLTQKFKELEMEKSQLQKNYCEELRSKDVEITMQKVTIQHLQDALVALKRGQSIPISVTTKNGVPCGKVFHI